MPPGARKEQANGQISRPVYPGHPQQRGPCRYRDGSGEILKLKGDFCYEENSKSYSCL